MLKNSTHYTMQWSKIVVRMLPTKCRFIWHSSYIGGDFFRNQPIRNKNCLWRQNFVNGSGQNEQALERTFHRCFLPIEYFKSVYTTKNIDLGWVYTSKCYTLHTLVDIRFFLARLTKDNVSFCFRNRPIRNKNYLWWPCLLTDRNEMSILYRGPSKDASYQVSVHLA
jgi:hypothetical protein